MVGSTADDDARDNTATRYTGDDTAATDDDSDLGVPIYWLGGPKVADEYRDFYDGSWNDEDEAKDESGSDRNFTGFANWPITGSKHDGTEAFSGSNSRGLGASSVQVGVLYSDTSGPLSSSLVTLNTTSHPLYGLSPVFRVEGQTTITVPVETTPVPTTWSLVPSGLVDGDSFRLLFIGTNGRDASSSDIAVYNTFLQNQVETNGHADIRAHSATFRMLGSTEDVDARDNTGTTGTGVPIYWLGGAKVADNYADFYDGDWDQETMGARETGVSVSIGTVWKIWTGSAQDGTEAMNAGGTESRALGNAGGHWVMQGSPNGSDSAHGPIASDTASKVNIRGLYGLSGVFTVDASLDAVNNPPVFSADTDIRTVPENSPTGTSVGDPVTATDADAGDAVTYAITGGADQALFRIDPTSGVLTLATVLDHENPRDADTNNVYLVTVTATGGTGNRALTTDQAITVTVTDVDELPMTPGAPTVEAVDGTSDSLSVTWTAPSNIGRPDIESYDLRYRQGNSGMWTDGPQDVTGTSATITGLDAASEYQVQVQATNEDGDGGWSASGTGSTNATAGLCLLPAERLWSACLTAGELSSGGRYGYQSSPPVGTLAPGSFDIGATTYTVTHLFDNDQFGGTTHVQMNLSPILSEADASTLTLHLGDDISLSFGDATYATGTGFSSHQWFRPAALGWSVGQKIVVGITQAEPEAPVILSVSAPNPGTYAIDATLSVPVIFSAAVTVSGTPQLALDIGGETRQADYESGSGEQSLLFSYTVADGDEDTDGIEVLDNGLALNGGAISAGGKAATLTQGNFTFSSVLVDGVRPTLVSAETSVDGNTVSVTFSESLSSADANRFTVSQANDPSVTSATIDANDDKVVTLTLSRALSHDDTLALEIAPNAVQDAAGNYNDRLSGSVTNNVPPPNAAPVFTSDAAFTADENQTAVGTVIATDADAGDTVTYAVTGGDDQARFQIGPTSGVLTFARRARPREPHR